MADLPPIALPAPIFRGADGELDHAMNARYAEHLAGTWIEHVVVAGPMGAGESCTVGQRATVVDLWARHHPPEHLIVACWQRREIERVLSRGMLALVMLRRKTDAAVLDALADLPAGAIAYTNPRYSPTVITASIAGEARRAGALPSALKFSKVTLPQLAQVRAAAGPEVRIIHGSSRNIAGSLTTGANLVVAAPLAALPQPWPTPALDSIQRASDSRQQTLDAQADHSGRVAIITELARSALSDHR